MRIGLFLFAKSRNYEMCTEINIQQANPTVNRTSTYHGNAKISGFKKTSPLVSQGNTN